jgi:hypothetical protein
MYVVYNVDDLSVCVYVIMFVHACVYVKFMTAVASRIMAILFQCLIFVMFVYDMSLPR